MPESVRWVNVEKNMPAVMFVSTLTQRILIFAAYIES